VLVAAGFSVPTAVALLGLGWEASWASATLLLCSVLLFGLVVAWQGRGAERRTLWSRLLELLFVGLGLNLILQALISYLRLETLPLIVVAGGSLLSILLLAVTGTIRSQGGEGARRGVLYLGMDGIQAALAQQDPESVAGVVVDPADPVPAGLPVAGEPREFGGVLAKSHSRIIVVSSSGERWPVPPRHLLEARWNGAQVVSSAELYEQRFLRVCSAGLTPGDYLFSPELTASAALMAIQAVYTNLLGLLLLLAFMPVLSVVAILIAAFGGRGPILEAVECLGLQEIPFQRLRFRTKAAGHSEETAIGRWILRLRLAALPELINVVRGEMGFFGPPPVRTEFARRLSGLIPFYRARFQLRPGIMGWSQINLRPRGGVPEEPLQLEYDLFYMKQTALTLDLEILLRTIVKR
jgi:lipopolysaccharide/colanic/teichoic acid biosynthesis glycosyltransferase